MSILIKGMEMPKNCWLCPLSVLYENPRDMLRCKITKEEVLRGKIDSNCPIIEVPPHGRLIDENVIRQYAKDVVLANDAKHRCIDATVLCEIPCVIEADSEEING